MPDGTRRLTNDQLNRLEQLSMRATGQPCYNPADLIFYRKWLHDGGSLEWLEEIVEATIQSKGEGGLGSMAYFKRQMTRYLAEKASSEVVPDSAPALRRAVDDINWERQYGYALRERRSGDVAAEARRWTLAVQELRKRGFDAEEAQGIVALHQREVDARWGQETGRATAGVSAAGAH